MAGELPNFYFMDNQGWVKIYRKIYDNPAVSKDAEHTAIWVWLLTHAAYKEVRVDFAGKIITLSPGQLTTGRGIIAKECHVDESKVERIIKLFKSEQQIEQQTSNKCRLITVNNWNCYQQIEQQTEQPVNNKRTTSEQPVNTKEEYKNIRRERNKEEDKHFLLEICLHFKRAFEKERCELTKGRETKLLARLKTWKRNEIEKAIDNFASDPFYRGENDRGWTADLDFIIRSDEQIEKGLNLGLKETKRGLSPEERKKLMYS